MTEIDELLRQSANAVERDEEAERRAISRAQRALSAVIAAATQDDLSHSRRLASQQRERSLAIPAWSIGALSSFAALVVAVFILVGHDGAVQPPSAAAAVLERAAKSPGMVSPLHLESGQVWYVEEVSAGQMTQDLRTCKARCYGTRVIRWWVGPSRYSMHQYRPRYSAQLITVTKQPPNVPMHAARFSARWSGVGPGYDQMLHYNVMLTTPTDVRSLRKLLSHLFVPTQSKPEPHWLQEQMIFGNIAGILSQPRVPARMLSGLYRLLATLPGISLRGQVTDTLGRPAVEVLYRFRNDGPGSKTRTTVELLFDPKTYALLDVLNTSTGKYAQSSDLAYVRSGLVSRIGGLPTGSEQTANPY
jgi:hypothetical protein